MVATKPAMPPITSRAVMPELFLVAAHDGGRLSRVIPAKAGITSSVLAPKADSSLRWNDASELHPAGDRLELLQPLAHRGELDADADLIFGRFGRVGADAAAGELEPLKSSQPRQARLGGERRP